MTLPLTQYAAWATAPIAGPPKLAESFYRELRSESAADDALARAQREAIRPQADYTWSAYVQFGNVNAQIFDVCP